MGRAASSNKSRISTKELVTMAAICAIMTAGKELMNFLPNIHPVTVLTIFATLLLGWKALYPVAGFAFLEMCIYGVSLWSGMYFIVWPLLVCVSMAFRQSRDWVFWAIISGAFGLCFGAFYAIPYLIVSGPQTALSFWLAGLSFDAVHCVASFFMTLVFLPILCRLAKAMGYKI
ncbi:MAG: hypothetical protein IJM08_05510 [Firmicutes bacterium]|nr:hypothetical protein [Bacillota bacterium]